MPTLSLTPRTPGSLSLVAGSRNTLSFEEIRALGLFNVMDYGAVGDGVTNDTAAIAAAMAAAILGEGDLWFPPGTYLTDKISYLPGNAAQSVSWLGAGKNLTTIKKRTSDGADLFQINANPATFYVSGFKVEGITFQGVAANTPHVVQANDVVRATFRNCAFTTGLVGFQAQGGIGLHFDDCDFSSNVNGIVLDKYTSFSGYPNLNVLSNCQVTSNTGWGVKFDGGSSLQLSDCDIETNGTNGVSDSGGLVVGALIGSESSTVRLGVTVERCWFEGNSGGASYRQSSGRNKLAECYFAANPNSTNDINIVGGRYVLVDCDQDTNKTVSLLEGAGASSPNYIINTDILGGVTIDAVKTLWDQGAWTTYTPTIAGTGWALGNGTAVGNYRQVGKTVHFRAFFTFGTTSTFGSASPTVAFPVAMLIGTSPLLSAEANHVGSNIYMLYPSAASTTSVRLNAIGASGASAAVTSAVPFAWASTDTLTVNGTFEAA